MFPPTMQSVRFARKLMIRTSVAKREIMASIMVTREDYQLLDFLDSRITPEKKYI